MKRNRTHRQQTSRGLAERSPAAGRPAIWSAALALALASASSLALVVPALAAPATIAVFPFELLDTTQDGELFPKVRPEETRRLVLLTEDLRNRLAALQKFSIVGLDPIAAEIKSAAPLHRCNGCEGDLAKKAGAELAVVGVVQKFSDTLLSVNIQFVDSATGAVIKVYSAGIQGNTDEAWLRGTSYIVRNRIAVEEPNR